MNMKKFWAGIAAFTFFAVLGMAWLFGRQGEVGKPAPVTLPTLQPAELPPAIQGANPTLERSKPVFVECADPKIRFEDFPYSGADERSSYRQFTLPIKEHDPIVLIAANLDDELWHEDSKKDDALIFRLFDLDAAFIPIAAYEVPPAGDWQRVSAHIGGFAQDGCGGVDLIYSLRKQNIFAVFSASPKDVDFSRSGCPLEQKDFRSSPGWHPDLKDETGEFCSYRAKCLQEYYAVEANRAVFTQTWLKQITEASLSIPSVPRADAIDARYLVLDDGGEIRDTKAGLIWQRCSVGQAWNGQNCTGEAKKFSFDEAKGLAGKGWRIPTVRELAGLIHCTTGKEQNSVDVKDGGQPLGSECIGEYQHPTILSEFFPDTPDGGYWSDSPYSGDGSHAWGVAFGNGYIGSNHRDFRNHVRLVRSGQ